MDYVILEKRPWLMTMNVNLDATVSNQKRVLVCYLQLDEYEQVNVKEIHHANKIEKYQIIKGFIQHDLCIDVCHCLDEKSVKSLSKGDYDYIFGFGPAYHQAIRQWPNAYRILYMTESPFWYSLKQETDRIQIFRKKTGIQKELVRTGVFYGRDDEKTADAIVCMCSKQFFSGINKPVYRIVPHGIKSNLIDSNLFEKRSEKHFLVFGTTGYVHKGVDMLVDVVKKHPDWHLHLCGNTAEMDEDGFAYSFPNIHAEGYLSVNDLRYKELVEQCMFVLLASCSEGMPTGIITCMRHGLIPIVSKNIGMEYCGEDKIFFFNELSENDIEAGLKQCVSMDREKLRHMSDSIYEYANEEFSIEAFSGNIADCIGSILKTDVRRVSTEI
jgi:glycosyltransferase involved in cell wall biosynthesis